MPHLIIQPRPERVRAEGSLPAAASHTSLPVSLWGVKRGSAVTLGVFGLPRVMMSDGLIGSPYINGEHKHMHTHLHVQDGKNKPVINRYCFFKKTKKKTKANWEDFAVSRTNGAVAVLVPLQTQAQTWTASKSKCVGWINHFYLRGASLNHGRGLLSAKHKAEGFGPSMTRLIALEHNIWSNSSGFISQRKTRGSSKSPSFNLEKRSVGGRSCKTLIILMYFFALFKWGLFARCCELTDWL